MLFITCFIVLYQKLRFRTSFKEILLFFYGVFMMKSQRYDFRRNHPAMQSRKGCSSYYKVLSKKSILGNKIYEREDTWHNKLNCRFTLDFWRKSWRLVSDLKYENKLRWLQYQIVRNSLKTNYIVNKAIPTVSPLCHYCGTETFELETTLHLFWLCGCVMDFWQELTDFFYRLQYFSTL